MGKQYRVDTGDLGIPTTSPEMRVMSMRPGKMDKDGKPIYFTEQAHKRMCDVNEIIKKYDKTGLITHISQYEARFGDMNGMEFKTAQDMVASAQSNFEALPSEIRNMFDNSPAALLDFMDDPSNREKAIELGLIKGSWTPETDGIGEHVPEGGNIDIVHDAEAELAAQ